jgi:hypothetical protein
MAAFFRARVFLAFCLSFSLTFVWMNGWENAAGDMKGLLALIVAALPG